MQLISDKRYLETQILPACVCGKSNDIVKTNLAGVKRGVRTMVIVTVVVVSGVFWLSSLEPPTPLWWVGSIPLFWLGFAVYALVAVLLGTTIVRRMLQKHSFRCATRYAAFRVFAARY